MSQNQTNPGLGIFYFVFSVIKYGSRYDLYILFPRCTNLRSAGHEQYPTEDELLPCELKLISEHKTRIIKKVS